MSITLKKRFEILRRDDFTCRYCGRRAPDVILEIDHIIPKSKNGTDEAENLTASCFECNRGKIDCLIEEATQPVQHIDESMDRDSRVDIIDKANAVESIRLGLRYAFVNYLYVYETEIMGHVQLLWVSLVFQLGKDKDYPLGESAPCLLITEGRTVSAEEMSCGMSLDDHAIKE